MKTRMILPLAAAAVLGLSACTRHDDAANNTADETLTLNEEGTADNGYDALGAGNLDTPAATDNAPAPADGAAGNGATANTL